jgi:phosphorylase kinase alpha/beta subunit
VTIGVFGYAEHVVTEPMSPKDLVKIIYDMCMPADPIEAVLQQEIIIYLADVFTSRATVFQGMLRLRIGWIIQAMKNELKDPATVEKLNLVTAERRVEQLSPHQVKQLLIYVLQDIDSRSALSTRQLHGALNRVPPLFYEKVYKILKRACGVNVRGKTLLQVGLYSIVLES